MSARGPETLPVRALLRFYGQDRLRSFFREGGLRHVDRRATCFFAYRYPMLDSPETTPWGFGLAGLRDIAAMKLEAVAGRGSRKDFIDLYFLCRRFDLPEIFRCFAEKYRGAGTDPYHRLRARELWDSGVELP